MSFQKKPTQQDQGGGKDKLTTVVVLRWTTDRNGRQYLYGTDPGKTTAYLGYENDDGSLSIKKRPHRAKPAPEDGE